MIEKKFNLLYEPWILVMDSKGKLAETSLLDLFEQAHEIKGLAGELPTQDMAVLRLLLAVLHASFTRADVHGNPSQLHTKSMAEALNRWKSLWDMGKFPMDVIRKRLEYYQERFYLIHPERPFYQVANLDKGTDYSATKLMGDLSESGNKVRLFQIKSGIMKQELSYSEAARWLLYLNGFDDTSSKPSVRGQNMPSPGAGWLGKLGLIYATGENLFETLLLNFVLVNDKEEVWKEGKTIWELDEVSKKERIEIPLPDSQLSLLTIQSRRLLLKNKNDKITGYKLLGGDFFQKENAFTEQMTVWRKDRDSKEEIYKPKRHNSSKQLWRDFSALVSKEESTRLPGIVSWIAILENNDYICSNMLNLHIASVQYGDKDFFVDNVFSDSISVNLKILKELGNLWITRISSLLKQTDDCVWRLGKLAKDLAVASGDKNGGEGRKNTINEEAYFRMDQPFREWLASIHPDKDDADEVGGEWLVILKKIIMDLGKQSIESIGTKAFIGSAEMNASKAYSIFKAAIHKIITEGQNG